MRHGSKGCRKLHLFIYTSNTPGEGTIPAPAQSCPYSDACAPSSRVHHSLRFMLFARLVALHGAAPLYLGGWPASFYLATNARARKGRKAFSRRRTAPKWRSTQGWPQSRTGKGGTRGTGRSTSQGRRCPTRGCGSRWFGGSSCRGWARPQRSAERPARRAPAWARWAVPSMRT